MASIYKRGKTWTASVSVHINGVYKKKNQVRIYNKNRSE